MVVLSRLDHDFESLALIHRQAAISCGPSTTHRRADWKPQELPDHNCINLRLPTDGGLYAWELEKGHRELHVRVDGQLVYNSITPRVNAALEGRGLALLPEDAVQPYLEKGRLERVLEDWCPPFPQSSPDLPGALRRSINNPRCIR